MAQLPALVIGSMTVPVELDDGANVEHEELVDRARTFSGRLRSVRTGHKRRWRIRTIPMPRAEADALQAVLLAPGPLQCSGTVIGGTVECDAQLDTDSIRPYADGQRVVMEFVLHEV